MSHPLNDERVRDLVRRKARSLVGKAGLKYQDVPDLEQKLLEGLTRRLRDLDSGQTEFIGLAHYLLQQIAASLLRHRSSSKEKASRFTTSYEESEPADPNSDGWQRLVDLVQDVNVFLAKLSPKDRQLASALMHASLTEVARERCIPRSTLVDHVRAWAAFFGK